MPVNALHGCAVFSKKLQNFCLWVCLSSSSSIEHQNNHVTRSWGELASPATLKYSLKLEHGDFLFFRTATCKNKKISLSSTCVRGPARALKQENRDATSRWLLPKTGSHFLHVSVCGRLHLFIFKISKQRADGPCEGSTTTKAWGFVESPASAYARSKYQESKSCRRKFSAKSWSWNHMILPVVQELFSHPYKLILTEKNIVGWI